jgi:hypothetical protein
MGMPRDTLLLSAGWVFIATLVAALAVYRKLKPAHANSLHSRMHAGIESIDCLGAFLTITAIIYTIVFAFILTDQVLTSVVERIARAFSFH